MVSDPAARASVHMKKSWNGLKVGEAKVVQEQQDHNQPDVKPHQDLDMNPNTYSSFLHWQLLLKALASAEAQIFHPRVSRRLDIGTERLEHVRVD